MWEFLKAVFAEFWGGILATAVLSATPFFRKRITVFLLWLKGRIGGNVKPKTNGSHITLSKHEVDSKVNGETPQTPIAPITGSTKTDSQQANSTKTGGTEAGNQQADGSKTGGSKTDTPKTDSASEEKKKKPPRRKTPIRHPIPYDAKYKELSERAMKGDAQAQFEIACSHTVGTDKNMYKAYVWFELAVLSGYDKRNVDFRLSRIKDKPTEEKIEEARLEAQKMFDEIQLKNKHDQLLSMAERGDMEAQFELACLYSSGNMKDVYKACMWLNVAMLSGYDKGRAESAMSDIIPQLTGIRADKAKREARKKLGEIKMNITHDELLSKAKQGDTEAQFNLACRYTVGTDKNIYKAYVWFTLAALSGYDKRKIDYRLGTIKDKPSDDEIKKAESEAQKMFDEILRRK